MDRLYRRKICCRALRGSGKCLVISFTIHTIQMERPNNRGKQIIRLRLMSWLPWPGSASEKLEMKLKLFAYFLGLHPCSCYQMHPQMQLSPSIRIPAIFPATPPTVGGWLPAFLEKNPVHTRGDPGTVLCAYWAVPNRSVG